MHRQYYAVTVISWVLMKKLYSVCPEGFGAGMADMQGTCGAATGMYMIAGALGSSGAIEKGMTKGRTYQTVKGLTAAFDEKNGSHICKELKGIETGKVLRSCDGCIEDAVRIAERLFSLEKTQFHVKSAQKWNAKLYKCTNVKKPLAYF